MEQGQEVKKGDILVTVEGMKMEVSSPHDKIQNFHVQFPVPFKTNIMAAKAGTIKSVLFKEKDSIPAFSTVIEFQEESS